MVVFVCVNFLCWRQISVAGVVEHHWRWYEPEGDQGMFFCELCHYHALLSYSASKL